MLHGRQTTALHQMTLRCSTMLFRHLVILRLTLWHEMLELVSDTSVAALVCRWLS